MERLNYDAAVIGAGAAGLGAAGEIAAAGLRVLAIDRGERAGGILNQCIHNGFGLNYFNEELTGPEYAHRAEQRARETGAEIRCGAAVVKMERAGEGFQLELLSRTRGVTLVNTRAAVLATGCRERCRGNLAIPGKRPAGVYTAGAAQKLLNERGMLPGSSAVIVGSGDIGLIMARRLSWCGIKVKAVVEILPRPSGLVRNIAQCLDDFGIPLLLSHAVVNIFGDERVEGVEVAPLRDGVPATGEAFRFECDTVLFSVGLIPENGPAIPLGMKLNPATGGAETDSNYESSVSGLFACGNALHVHDLVDFVSEEAEACGRAVVRKLNGCAPRPTETAVAGDGLKYVTPGRFAPEEKIKFSFRPLVTAERAVLRTARNGNVVFTKPLSFVCPAEMITAEFIPGAGALTFELNEVEQ